MFHNILGQALYLSLQLSLLEGQGGDFSFVCFRCLSKALGRTGPPRQALYISSRLPRNKMELVDNINTTMRRIKEGARTYRYGSME